MKITDIVALLNAFVPLIVLGAGFFMYRKGASKDATEAQERLITALKAEIDILRRKIEELEKAENKHDRLLETIRHALKSKGIKIIIEDDYVTLIDSGSGKSKITPIQEKLSRLEADEENIS